MSTVWQILGVLAVFAAALFPSFMAARRVKQSLSVVPTHWSYYLLPGLAALIVAILLLSGFKEGEVHAFIEGLIAGIAALGAAAFVLSLMSLIPLRVYDKLDPGAR